MGSSENRQEKMIRAIFVVITDHLRLNNLKNFLKSLFSWWFWRLEVQDLAPTSERGLTQHQNNGRAGCRWLTPVFLATQEAEIRRIEVRSQSGQIVQETLSRKKKSQKELVEWLKV
jgi:hypothetical protein